MDFNQYFRSGKLFLIAGPCVIEGEDSALYHAEKLCEMTEKLDIPYVYKSSCIKANRTAYESFTGIGIERGLAVLAKVKERFRIPVLTDIHETSECYAVAQVVDVLQIPAFLMRQTNLLTTAGLTGKVVNVKKAQFASPHDMQHVVEKIRSTGNDKILLTERGTQFGYGALVVDMRSFHIMGQLGYPTIIDCTHATQMRVGGSAISGGDRQFAPILAKASIAAGANGIFAEVHKDPSQAKSDSSTQFPLDQFEDFLLQTLELQAKIN